MDAGEQARRKRHPLRKAISFRKRPAARVATPIAAGASTVRNGCRVRRDSGAALERSIRLFTTGRMDPGEQTTRPFAFSRRRNPRLHHLEDKKLSSVSNSDAAKGLETKNPPKRGLGGVRSGRTVEERQLIRPSRDSVRMLPHRSNDPSIFSGLVIGAARITSLSRKSQATIACNGRGV